jgi:hypothetical protein
MSIRVCRYGSDGKYVRSDIETRCILCQRLQAEGIMWVKQNVHVPHRAGLIDHRGPWISLLGSQKMWHDSRKQKPDTADEVCRESDGYGCSGSVLTLEGLNFHLHIHLYLSGQGLCLDSCTNHTLPPLPLALRRSFNRPRSRSVDTTGAAEIPHSPTFRASRPAGTELLYSTY